jgi:peptide chain release factor 2
LAEVQHRIKELREEYDALASTLKLPRLEQERAALEDKMAQPGFWDDPEAAQETVLRLKSVKGEVDAFARVKGKLDDLEVLAELAEAEDDEGARGEVDREVGEALKGLERLRLRTYFTGEHDPLGAFVTIQAGAGGVDACDWAEMVLRMLTRYAERRGFTVELIDLDREEPAGIRSATINVKGRGAFGWLKSERGTHRLVRISPFDAQARRQTAFAAVDVTPEFDDKIEIDINESDLKVDTFSAGGPGGQHVNKTQSAIRITHKPSGVVVQCQTQRNQHANRRKAMQMLQNRLYQMEIEKRAAAAGAAYQNKSNMGFGASDRIRSYTLQPFTLVKDGRTGHEETDVQEVLDGGLDPFVEAFLRKSAEGGLGEAKD